jgi:predicted ribonuclease YlaK
MKKKMINFYDTSSLLLKTSFDDENKFLVSSITIKELENIKTSTHKNEEVKYSARNLLKFLYENTDKYDVILHKSAYEKPIVEADFELNNDSKILSDVIYANNNLHIDDIDFVTNDFSLALLANQFLGDGCIKAIAPAEEYTGYIEVSVSDSSVADIYQDKNPYGLLCGEYLIVREEDKVADVLVWQGDSYRHLNYNSFTSDWFGEVIPYKNDIYQKLLFDSLCNNTMTIIRGKAGTGKSYTAMAYLMYALEKGIIDKIVILCNPVATKDSARLGFYPGSKESKLLDS